MYYSEWDVCYLAVSVYLFCQPSTRKVPWLGQQNWPCDPLCRIRCLAALFFPPALLVVRRSDVRL